jgi:hypothetical protein
MFAGQQVGKEGKQLQVGLNGAPRAYLAKQLLLVLAPQLMCLDLRCGSMTAAAQKHWFRSAARTS